MDTWREEQTEVRVGPQGRIVIPARMRERLGIGAGERLVARVEDGRVILEKREYVLKRVRGRFAGVSRDVSLADELISERRQEARRDHLERPSGEETAG